MAYLASANIKHNIFHMAEFSVSELIFDNIQFFYRIRKDVSANYTNIFKFNLGMLNFDLNF